MYPGVKLEEDIVKWVRCSCKYSARASSLLNTLRLIALEHAFEKTRDGG